MSGKEFRSKVTSKGQLTLPAGISAFLHVKPGDHVRFEIVEGTVLLGSVPLRERLEPIVGAWREGSGKTAESIDAELRDLRGPRPE